MLLSEILRELDRHDHHVEAHNMVDTPVESVTLDSRTLTQKGLFIALQGTHINGESFIKDAIQKGAACILLSKEKAETHAKQHLNTPFLSLQNVRLATSHLSKLFYPDQPENIVGITGTNGKTSTADMTRQIWETLGHPSASLGTLGVRSQNLQMDKHLTTPEAPYLHKTLQHLCDNHITHVAMEASSHGLDQYRLDSVQLKAAGFTNITPEHLDYHKSMEVYLEAKLGLFKRILPQDGLCVLNADMPDFERAQKACTPHPILSYGYEGQDITIQSLSPSKTGQDLCLSVFGETFQIKFPLIGEFQVYNALCALGLVLACDKARLEGAIKALESLKGIPGRLEYIAKTPQGAPVYIDHAHTPDGLENLLKALRNHSDGKLHLVLGAGGNRDSSTRASRGKIAQNMADAIYVCDDNPRNEDPKRIRRQLLEGCPAALETPDRFEAIHTAIGSMGPTDTLVVSGKGREQGQIVQGTTHPFDDAEAILKSIRDLS